MYIYIYMYTCIYIILYDNFAFFPHPQKGNSAKICFCHGHPPQPPGKPPQCRAPVPAGAVSRAAPGARCTRPRVDPSRPGHPATSVTFAWQRLKPSHNWGGSSWFQGDFKGCLLGYNLMWWLNGVSWDITINNSDSKRGLWNTSPSRGGHNFINHYIPLGRCLLAISH